jgi:MoaA/NifB/PqqE/SkfB family radical SAM enzyme
LLAACPGARTVPQIVIDGLVVGGYDRLEEYFKNMSIEKPNLKTFCPAPWFQIRSDNNKDKRPCCEIEFDSNPSKEDPIDYLNSDHLIKLKKELHSGIKSKECQRCWFKEDNGFKSQRQNLLNIITDGKSYKDSWVNSFFKKKTTYNSDFLVSADIKVGNTCNFNCIMCQPENSSQIYNDWFKRQDSEFVKDRLTLDKNYFSTMKNFSFKNNYYRQFINNIFDTTNNLLWLRLVGGEPMLDSGTLKKIKELPSHQKNKLKLAFVTNGSVDLNKTLDYIEGKKFKHVQINISLEGIGKIQEYARYGSNWEQIEKNILQVQNYSKNVNLSITYVIQTPTLLRLKDLLTWVEKHNLFLSISPLYRPDYLSLKTLPKEFNDAIKEDLTKFTNVIRQDVDTGQDNETPNALSGKQFIKILNNSSNFDELLFKKYLRYIKWYEENKNIPTLSEIIPEWEPYFKNIKNLL